MSFFDICEFLGSNWIQQNSKYQLSRSTILNFLSMDCPTGTDLFMLSKWSIDTAGGTFQEIPLRHASSYFPNLKFLDIHALRC